MLVILFRVSHVIQREILHRQRKYTSTPRMLLTFSTCIGIWRGSLQLLLPSLNYRQTLVEFLFFNPLSSQISSNLSEKLVIKNINKTGDMLYPCLTPTS